MAFIFPSLPVHGQDHVTNIGVQRQPGQIVIGLDRDVSERSVLVHKTRSHKSQITLFTCSQSTVWAELVCFEWGWVGRTAGRPRR